MKLRPSSLPMLETCPRWVGRERTETLDAMDEAADEGTLVHAAMDRLAGIDPGLWEVTIESDPSLDADLQQVVRDCAQQVSHYFAFKPTVLRDIEARDVKLSDSPGMVILCEVGVDPRVVSPGTADLIVLQGSNAVLIDYKTNRVVRDHDRQQQAYVLGIFNEFPHVNYVTSKIVSPRLGGDAHPPLDYSREVDCPRLQAELKAIKDAAEDPFTPGVPGDQCLFCSGNGRCPWQAASLGGLPEAETGLVAIDWKSLITPATADARGARRGLIRWLEAFVTAVKDDDKAWAEAHEDADLPGFTKVVSIGRASLDKTMLQEINTALSVGLGIPIGTLISFLTPEKAALVEFLKMDRGWSEKKATEEVNETLSRFVRRGAPIISFRAQKQTKQIQEKQ